MARQAEQPETGEKKPPIKPSQHHRWCRYIVTKKSHLSPSPRVSCFTGRRVKNPDQPHESAATHMPMKMCPDMNQSGTLTVDFEEKIVIQLRNYNAGWFAGFRSGFSQP